jgi:NAD(P)-dependent dehydrogenase (short-subunit alcohol dehydrogenase family)
MTLARLSNRIIIVTGATSGIGRAIAERCLVEGAIVVANGRRQRALEELREAHGDRVVMHAADLSEENACQRLVAAAQDLGEVRGVAHAAGTVRRGEDPRLTTARQFRDFVDENLTPAFELTSAAFAAMADGTGGSIVILGSQLAHVGSPGYETYSAVKGGVTAMARTFAAEAGPRNVRVNVLAPGLVHTAMAYVDRDNFDELVPGIAERHPLRRIGVPGDLAGPAVFLLSDDAAWITGQTLIVDGGFTAV